MHHPNKRVQRTKAPRWDGSEIGGTRGPQLPKITGAGCPQTTGSAEPPADYGKRTTGSAEPPASYNYSQAEGPEDRERRIVVLQPLARGAPDSRCSRAGEMKQGAAAHTTGWWNKRANADLQK